MEQFLSQAANEEVRYWISHNLNNYMSEQEKEGKNLDVGTVEHIIDFLNSPDAPNRLKKMSYEEALNSSKKWTERLVKKAKDIIETEEDTEVLKDYKDGFRFVKLKGQSAFLREGSLMSHCVGSYHGKQGVSIYSLRDGNNNPHCTIEVTEGSEGRINQIKGKGNGSIHPKYIKYVIDILGYFKMEVRDSEMSNLGYDTIDNDIMGEIESNFDGIKYVTYNGKRYFYRYSNLKKRTA